MRNVTGSLVDRVMQELTTMINSGALRPGDFLPSQKALARQLGVGISTVREATQVLTRMGLLASRPGKGTWVSMSTALPLSSTGTLRTRLGELRASMVFEARTAIEVSMTEFAALRASPNDLENIWSSLHTMEQSVGDDMEFGTADLKFHLAVAQASHNALLIQFYEVASELLSDVIKELDRLPGVKADALAAHREIAMAIEAHDVERATSSASTHLRNIGMLIRRFS